ncbi:MAG: hypothetical protein IIB14_08335 [Chloroflexi bacterium]|nr:hypothetical protein [Chloroflexota bacterium]
MGAALGVLKIFISKGCAGCRRALEPAAMVRKMKPRLIVEIIDLAINPTAGAGLVFAVPACVYDSKPIFFGNPSPLELQAWLDRLEPEV